MNSPQPIPAALPTIPSVGAASTATVASGLLGYGAMWLANKYQLPLDVTGGILSLLFTGVTSLWHRAAVNAPPR